MISKSLKKKWAIYGTGLWNVLSKTRPEKNNHLLIIQLDPLGDACTLVPTALMLQAAGYKVDVICRSGLESIWKEFLPQAKVFDVDDGNMWSRNLLQKKFPDLFSGEYDAVFALSISPTAAFLASLVKARGRYGLLEEGKHYKGSRVLFNKTYMAAGKEHVSERFKNVLMLHFDRLEDVAVQAPVVQKLSEPYILIHPGGKWLPRRWPAENFKQLTEHLCKESLPVKLLLHESEKDLIEYFRQNVKHELVSICETKTVEDLIRTVKYCSLFIGNDSGPSHLANLYHKQTIVLWGPGNYERIRPLGDNNTVLIRDIECRPCRQYRDPYRCQIGEKTCIGLTMISVEEVIDVARKKLPLIPELQSKKLSR